MVILLGIAQIFQNIIFQNAFNLILRSLLIELLKIWFYAIVASIYIRVSIALWNQERTVYHQQLEHNYCTENCIRAEIRTRLGLGIMKRLGMTKKWESIPDKNMWNLAVDPNYKIMKQANLQDNYNYYRRELWI